MHHPFVWLNADEADLGGQTSVGAVATLLSSHAEGPRATAGDKTNGKSGQPADRRYESQLAVRPRPICRVGQDQPITDDDTEAVRCVSRRRPPSSSWQDLREPTPSLRQHPTRIYSSSWTRPDHGRLPCRGQSRSRRPPLGRRPAPSPTLWLAFSAAWTRGARPSPPGSPCLLAFRSDSLERFTSAPWSLRAGLGERQGRRQQVVPLREGVSRAARTSRGFDNVDHRAATASTCGNLCISSF
jgi:hypothetical protein